MQNNQKPRKAGVLFVLFLGAISWVQLAQAQQKPLGSELGLRYGAATALSYRFYLQEKQAGERGFELLFAKSNQSLLFTVLYERLQQRFTPGFYTYYGFGGSIGGWNDRQRLALDMVLGSCYYLPYLPVNIDFSLRPFAVLTGEAGVNAELALSLRWVF